MLHSLTILEKIILDPPAPQIYSRLGFKKRQPPFLHPGKKKRIVISWRRLRSSA
jgi:hypothetical protein